MKKIKKIKIGPYNVQVVHENMTEFYGLFKHGTQQIVLQKDMLNQLEESTLAHEILHALLAYSGALELIKEPAAVTEESLVVILESTFYSFLKQNTNFYTR